MKLVFSPSLLLGQILSLGIAYKLYIGLKYTSSFLLIDIILVPMTGSIIGLIISFRNKPVKDKKYAIKAIICGICYFCYLFAKQHFHYKEQMLLLMPVEEICYLSSLYYMIFSEKLQKNKTFHYTAYFIVFIISSILAYNSQPLYTPFVLDIAIKGVPTVCCLFAFSIFTNILTNEHGFGKFLLYMASISCGVLFFVHRVSYSNIELLYADFVNNRLINLWYYSVSLACYLYTIAYIQKYGILSFNMLSVTNILLYMIMIGVKRNFSCVLYTFFIVSIILNR